MKNIEVKINDETICIAGREGLSSVGVSIHLIKDNGVAELIVFGGRTDAPDDKILWAHLALPNHCNLSVRSDEGLSSTKSFSDFKQIRAINYLDSRSFLKISSNQLPNTINKFSLTEDFINVDISYHCITDTSYLSVYSGSNTEGEPKKLLELKFIEQINIDFEIGQDTK